MDAGSLWAAADGFGRGVALLLLAMSSCSWALIGWKSWLFWQARRSLQQALPAFWAAPDWDAARAQLQRFDGERLLLPLFDAVRAPQAAGSLAAGQAPAARRVRLLRDALQLRLRQLRRGQVMLASIGATAPFVGLLGTVWGIYQALHGLAGGGALSIERLSGPVGEALVMTAAGLVVAIPAVLAYNAFNQRLADCEAELEGFAHDLVEAQA